MKLGIISDTHGNLQGWKRAWELCLHDADVIFHCGDLLYHGPKFQPVEAYDPKVLAEALSTTPQPLLVARGNADSEVDQLVVGVPIQQPYVFAQVEGVRVLATHGHVMSPDDLGPLCVRWGVQYLLTGHLHVPCINRYEGYTHLNPGTPTYPLSTDDARKRPTCAVIEDGEVRVVDLATGTTLEL
jgi:putative phosphoesterase